MIYVDRSRVHLPPDVRLRSHRASDELLASAGDESFTRDRAQRGLEIIQINRMFRPYLDELFNGKCAFCESKIGPGSFGQVMRFRPKADARQLDGHTDRLHYYWLAYRWDNYYSTCQICNSNKNTLFPVLGARAGFEDDTSSERALLLDPCRHDPENFLLFTANGLVLPRQISKKALASYDGSHPGKVTIDVFGLNRTALVEARREVAAHISTLLAMNRGGLSGETAAELHRLMRDDAQYSALVRELLREIRSDLALPAGRVRRRSRRVAVTTPEPEVSTRPVKITRVEIENFRAVESFAVDLSPEREKWKVLLGENATGKSSVLHAISLALMGKDFATDRFRRRNWLTRKDGRIAARGSIAVYLSTEPDPVRINYTRDGLEFRNGSRGTPTFVRGYGAIRLTTPRSMQTDDTSKNVLNLWDLHRKLPDAKTWLPRLKAEQFEPVRNALRDLLLLENDAPIEIKRRRIEIALHGGTFSTDELSAGYADVFNIACDIIAGFPGGVGDMNNAYGIILIDELGPHLHPRWKMQIVASLKRCFPQMQFIVTTHDPLCLRELEADEIVVMERDETGVHMVTDVPSPKLMRVDQLLTSRFFGLASTIDPRLDDEFREYYALLASQQLTAEEKERYEQLKRRLSGSPALGFSRREQLLYEFIDEYLAEELRSGRRPASGAIRTIDPTLKEQLRVEWRKLTELPKDIR